ncbi:MAG: hypothetical protein AAF849_01765 [Bacteroidota bacterium]
MAVRKHIVITGTGRTGTTFLVELLTKLGLDTGFSLSDIATKKNKLARAGLETDLRSDNCPYIVKDPWFCDYANEIFEQENIEIEHVFIPIRDLKAAAESRRYVTKAGMKEVSFVERLKYLLGKRKRFKGGLWHTNSFKQSEQESVLLRQVYKLMLALSDANVPITLIKYPRSVKDGIYLFQKLKPILKDISTQHFMEVYTETVQPNLVHSFNHSDH